MNTGLTLALKIVQDAGYKVTEPAKDHDKFIPVNGQIGYVSDGNNSCQKILYAFVSMDNRRYKCSKFQDAVITSLWDNFESIPGVVQMEPYDPAYTGAANVLFADGRIAWYYNSNAANNIKCFHPVFFQKLGE